MNDRPVEQAPFTLLNEDQLRALAKALKQPLENIKRDYEELERRGLLHWDAEHGIAYFIFPIDHLPVHVHAMYVGGLEQLFTLLHFDVDAEVFHYYPPHGLETQTREINLLKARNRADRHHFIPELAGEVHICLEHGGEDNPAGALSYETALVPRNNFYDPVEREYFKLDVDKMLELLQQDFGMHGLSFVPMENERQFREIVCNFVQDHAAYIITAFLEKSVGIMLKPAGADGPLDTVLSHPNGSNQSNAPAFPPAYNQQVDADPVAATALMCHLQQVVRGESEMAEVQGRCG